MPKKTKVKKEEVIVEDKVEAPVEPVKEPTEPSGASLDGKETSDVELTVSDEVKEVEDKVVPAPKVKKDKIVKNEGVMLEIESVCKWCGAGHFTQTLVFCSEMCKNSYIANKGL